jgi:hypothetical protein
MRAAKGGASGRDATTDTSRRAIMCDSCPWSRPGHRSACSAGRRVEPIVAVFVIFEIFVIFAARLRQ